MTGRWLSAAALTLAWAVPIAAQASTLQDALEESAAPGAERRGVAPAVGPVGRLEAEVRVAHCAERKFETSVETEIDGEMRRARVILCPQPEDSDIEWAATLDRAAVSVEERSELPPETKARLAAEIRAEAARIRSPEGR